MAETTGPEESTGSAGPQEGSSAPREAGLIEKVLLMVSGGPDSAVLAHKVAKELRRLRRGASVSLSALYLRTGDPTDDREIEAADRIMSQIGGRLEIIDIRDAVRALGARRLMIHSEADLMPFGNAVALSLATAYALQVGAGTIMLALHRDDAEENLEYTRGFIDQIEQLAAYARVNGPTIETPFIDMRKADVFRLGIELGVDFAATWSCIRRGDRHCGQCGACRARRKAFMLVGVTDPTIYNMEPVALESVASNFDKEPVHVD